MKELTIVKKAATFNDRTLRKYLEEVDKIKLITPEEEVELTKKIKKNDQLALKKLVNANLRFVISVAKQYHCPGSVTLSDLIGEGNLGLIKAALKFDETRGFKFISYAVWWIRMQIFSALYHSDMIRLPLNRSAAIRKMSLEFSRLEQKHQRDPLPEELAEQLGVSTQRVCSDRDISQKHVSIDSPIGNEEEFRLLDVLSSDKSLQPDHIYMANFVKEELSRIINLVLTQKERMVVISLYGLHGNKPLSYNDIKKKFGINNISDIRRQALHKLRNVPENEILKQAYYYTKNG